MFLDTLDDTLINRLCHSLLCRQKHDVILEKDNVEEFVHQCTTLLNTLTDNQTHLNDIQRKMLKLICCSLLRATSPAVPIATLSKILIDRAALGDAPSTVAIIQILMEYVDNIFGTLNDAKWIYDLFTVRLCESVYACLTCTANIHTKGVLVKCFALVALYEQKFVTEDSEETCLPKPFLSDVNRMEEIGRLFLSSRLYFCQKYNVNSYSIPFRLTLSEWNIGDYCFFPLYKKTYIVYFLCKGALYLFDLNVEEQKRLLQIDQDAELCVEVICMHVRLGGVMKGELWNDVVSCWYRNISECIQNTDKSKLTSLTSSIVRCSKGRCRGSIELDAYLLDCLVHEGLSQLEKSQSKVTESSYDHRVHSWELISVFCRWNTNNIMSTKWLDLMKEEVSASIPHKHRISRIFETDYFLQTTETLCHTAAPPVYHKVWDFLVVLVDLMQTVSSHTAHFHIITTLVSILDRILISSTVPVCFDFHNACLYALNLIANAIQLDSSDQNGFSVSVPTKSVWRSLLSSLVMLLVRHSVGTWSRKANESLIAYFEHVTTTITSGKHQDAASDHSILNCIDHRALLTCLYICWIRLNHEAIQSIAIPSADSLNSWLKNVANKLLDCDLTECSETNATVEPLKDQWTRLCHVSDPIFSIFMI